MTDRKPDFLWHGRPVYRCTVCRDRFERVDDLAAVERHELERHPPQARTSALLGADGQPIVVVTIGGKTI